MLRTCLFCITICLIGGGLLSFVPSMVLAHPMGNFTINRYSRLELHTDQILLYYVVDFAEVPALAELLQMDTNGDKQISEEEEHTYLDGVMRALLTSLALTINEQPQPLTPITARMEIPPGEQAMPTLRLEFDLTIALPPAADAWQLHYRDNNVVTQKTGWQEIIVTPSAEVTLLAATVPTQDVSNALRNYPPDLLSPVRIRQATVRFASATTTMATATMTMPITLPGAAVAGQTPAPQAGLGALLANAENDRFAALLMLPLAGPGAVIFVLLAAFGWGGVHALSPGHGKSIVAAYLVGARGTVGHALFLGLTTTVTHTIGVFALGFATLLLSQFILPEAFYPWLGVFSGLLVVLVGLSLLHNRWQGWQHAHAHTHHHDHDSQPHVHDGVHGHNHLPPATLTWRSLLALGVSGGLLPCPSALVVMLGAIAFDRVAFGLLLILIFSLGLATVLTVTGLLFVYAGRLFERIPAQRPLFHLLPIVSAAVVTLLGLGITLQALMQMQLLGGAL